MEEQEIMKEEIEHLEDVQAVITKQMNELDGLISKNASSILEQKKYLWENIYELDPEEIASSRVLVSGEHDSYDRKINQKRKLAKLYDNSYFARIDFLFDGEESPEALYIGLGNLMDDDSFEVYIYDWRAPVASMYYDFEIGSAYYEAPDGKITGNITQRRQLRVRNAKLEYAFISNHNIDDEILQKELANAGSTKMRNIVSTIQREQNKIIRDSDSSILIVQGVAGSGKTSIALHRVAYMLYKYRNNLNSSDVLIISPNSIFADYISNVLPELGEENISEVNFDSIAEHEIGKMFRFEPKYQQAQFIIGTTSDEDKRIISIRFKKSLTFLTEMLKYINNLPDKIIDFRDVVVYGYRISRDTIKEWYGRFMPDKTIFERLDLISERIADNYSTNNDVRLSKKQCDEIKNAVYELARTTDLMELYSDFISVISNRYPEVGSINPSTKKLLYEDIFPVVLMKIMLFGKGINKYNRIKHVVVDEMQDYSMVQFAILKKCFNCKMTILGDVSQVIDKSEVLMYDDLLSIFDNKDVSVIKMLKSYRSTFEISELCKKIGRISDLESVERHGSSPKINRCGNFETMVKQIEEEMDRVDLDKTTTVAIICKTSKQAEELYAAMDLDHSQKCNLMNDPDSRFQKGFIITNSYLVKGLEFDHVIVPDVSIERYHTERDRQILYIACTRALHELSLYTYSDVSSFITDD